jgi:hypothetical protein
MQLKEFKDYISSFPNGTKFKYGISKPFSWRGSYDEVAFSIIESPMTREEVLANIEIAYNKAFYGYKGGAYEYNDFTTVNFEEGGSRDYSGGKYTAAMIAKIENSSAYLSQEERLVKIAFV